MTNKQRIELLLEQVLAYSKKWVKKDKDGYLIYEDPIENVEVSAHYGATYTAASYIIYGKRKGDVELYYLGLNLLNSILEKWDENKKQSAFHFDFNNFALCVIYDILKEKEPELSKKIKSVILTTSDSKHNTINWLPMRWFVNYKRYEWTDDAKFKSVIDNCKSIIKLATNSDGGIEDILPKGESFNLQYDIATVGVLQFLRVNGEKYDLSKELGFLLNAVAPDGDINYQGRGINQIFGWSHWIYILSTTGKENTLNQALDYIYEKIPLMLSNQNIMLNDWDGSEKYLWWDYHYCSVYTAHFLFWLTLSLEDSNNASIEEVYINDCSTGLKIVKSDEYFVSIFEGRKKYLAEQGPIIVALWTKNIGMIVKGSFAPWQGMFGNDFSFSEIALRNFFGLLEVKYNEDWSRNRWVRKFLPSYQAKASVKYKPLFAQIFIEIVNDVIQIKFENPSSENVQIVIPSLTSSMKGIEVSVDRKPIDLHNVMNIRNQYSWLRIFQSKRVKAKEWAIKIKILQVNN